MPFYFENSVRAGPFRFDILQASAGLSVASKLGGFIGPPRAHHIKIGRDGIRYEGSIRSTARPIGAASNMQAQPKTTWTANVEMVEVDSGDVLQMRDEAFGAILDEINAQARQVRLAIVLPVLMAIISLIAALTIKIELAELVVLVAPLWLGGKWIDSSRRVTVLLYEFVDDTADAYGWLTEAFDLMMECSGKWHVEAGGAVKDLATWKQNAGAAHLVQKSPTDLSYSLPPSIKSNVAPPALQVGSQTIYFLPDVVLVQDGQTFGAVGYGDLQLSWQPSNFVEHEQPPDDALIVGYVWEHPNRDGGPDRRYSANRQLPICCYDAMHLGSANGLNELVEFSRSGIVQGFVAAVAALPRQSLGKATRVLR